MSRIVSFAWTTPALLAGAKTVTRRDWDDDYARRFSAGELITAFNRSPRHKGEPIATLRVVSVTLERAAEAPDSDWEAEGFEWFTRHPQALPKSGPFADLQSVSWESYCAWRRYGDVDWVFRFEVVRLLVEPPVWEPIGPQQMTLLGGLI